MGKERDKNVDILRGISALSVILGHAIQRGLIIDYNSNIIFKLIYTFHMPLFMFLSGYTLFMSKPQYSYNFIKKKFERLIIPTVVWSYLLYFIKDFNFVGIKPFIEFPQTIIDYTKILILHPDYIIWFTYIVFVCTAIIFIGKKYFEKYFFYFLVIATLLFNFVPEAYLGVYKINIYLPIFILGYITSKNKNIILKKLKYFLIPSIISYFVLFKYWNWTNGRLYLWIVAFSGMIIVYNFVLIIKKYKFITNILVFFGKYSLQMYLCQSLCLNIGIGTGVIRVTSIFISATCISIIAALITTKYSITNKLLYGRFNSQKT